MNRNQLIRKTLYATVAAVLGILGVAGVITAEQSDQWTQTAYEVLNVIAPLIGTGSLALAASKVHQGSDSKMTENDLERAVALSEAKKVNEQTVNASATDAGAGVEYADPALDDVVPAQFDADVVAEGARAYRQMVRQSKGDAHGEAE